MNAPRVSPLWMAWFHRYTRWYVPRHFHAVRVLKDAKPAPDDGGPLIVYLNHPSWWDPLICLLLARQFWLGRTHFAPIDAAAFQKYPFLARVGFFGVDQANRRGAAEFLRTAETILQHPNSVLWITAQGQFTDVRQRPIQLRPGLAHLLARVPETTALPLVIEYPFWTERTPEVLAAFGPPLKDSLKSAREWQPKLETAMESVADRLAAAVLSKDESRFETVSRGAVGVGGVYDLWRRGRAVLAGRRFQREHGAQPR